MKNFSTPNFLFLLLLVFLSSFAAMAQTPQFATAVGTGSNSFPFNSATNKAQYIYYPTDFTASPISGNITDVYVRSSSVSTATYSNLTLKLGHTGLTSFATGAGVAFEPGLSTVYTISSIPITTTVDGWVHFTLQTPFFYNGNQNLIFEASMTSTSGFSVRQNTIAGVNSRLYGAVTSPTGTGNTGQLAFGFDLQQNPCVSPPIAGAATTSSATTCSASPVTLNVTGNSVGIGQTYQWESSTTQAGTYTNVGSSSSTSNLTLSPTTTLWYRVAVTCGGVTTFSTPIEVTVTPPVNGGTFTINSAVATGGTNFQTFGDAVNYIRCGILGPVVFNVAVGSGPYNEQVTIPNINGTSSTNTIIFNGNGATIVFNSANASQRAGITLDGADYVTLDNLIIDGSGGTYGWGIQLVNQANNNLINNNTINVLNATNTAYNFLGISIGGSATTPLTAGNAGNNNTISGNTITGGYYAIILYGTSAAPYNTGNVVINNTIRDAYSHSVYVLGNTNTTVSRNDISRPTKAASTTTAGVFLTTGTSATLVENNKIHNMFDAVPASTSIFYGIYEGGTGAVGQENKVNNNLVYNINGNGTAYGIYNTGSSFMQAYHNTIVLDDVATTTGAAYGLYQTGAATNIEYRNNLVFISRSGTGIKRCIYFVTTTSSITSNNNDLYMNSTGGTNNNVGQFGTINYLTLADWKTANGGTYDQQSVSLDPIFVSAGGGDFKPTNGAMDNLGAPVGVTTDILNVTRNVTTPDIGAYEFDGPLCTSPPAAGAATASPSGIVCSGSNATLDLSGNTTGIGQTYQWQSSTTIAGPYTNIGGLSNSTSLNISPGSTMFYRAIVTCNGVTSISTPVEVIVSAGLAGGTYTINSTQPQGGTNYPTFTAAAEAIRCGILGPVVFNVTPGSGPYTEQVTIGNIAGTSATNTITFNGNGATLVFNSTNANERAGIRLNGADYVTINNLIIDGSAGTYGWGIQLMNQADNNVISNNTINVLGGSNTAYNFLGISIGGSITTPIVAGNGGNNNQITGNTITGGYYPIIMYGNSAAPYNTGNVVSNNAILDAYSYSIYLLGNVNATISRNDISRPTKVASTTTAGVFLTTGTSANLVEKNRIHNMFDAMTTNASTFYGVYVGGVATASQENKVINNLVYNINSNGPAYGIYNSSSAFMQAYHNTLIFDDAATTTGTTYGLYQTGSALGIDYRNNIVFIARAGTGIKRCIYFVTTTSGITSNNNDLYLNSSAGTNNNLGQWGTTNFATLTDWKTANAAAYDQQSLDLDPAFVNPGSANYVPTSSLLDNKGTPVGVLTDIVNVTRSSTTPDIGAYEFTTLTAGINMAAEKLITPVVAPNGCYNDREIVTIRIRNSSLSTIDFSINPVTITTIVTGAVNATLTATLNTGTLASDATLDVPMAQNLNMSTAGGYVFNASTSVAGDVYAANDAMQEASRTKEVLSAGAASASPGSYCVNGGKPVLSVTGATGFSNLQWQESATAGSGFTNITGAITSPYTVANNITQTMYYRLVATCDINTNTTPETVVTLVNPVVTSTTPASRCGPGLITLGATGSAGTTLNWFTTATGGQPVGTGNSFSTNVTTTTDFYVEANVTGGSTGASPILVTEMDLGTTTDQFEIQNVSGTSINVTGWKVAISNSYTDINSVNTIVMVLSGSMAPGEVKTWTDLSTAPNYWGSNILWNPAQQGWAAILDNNNTLMDIVFIDWPAANIASSNIVVGTTAINASTKWTGNGVNVTTVPGTHSVSRQGSSDNNVLTDFAINPLSIGTLNSGMTLPFTGFGCSSARTLVTATVAGAGNTMWTGAVSSAWENPGNWSCGAVPDATTDVVIPANAIVIVSSEAHAKSLNVNPTASITVVTGFNLTIHQ